MKPLGFVLIFAATLFASTAQAQVEVSAGIGIQRYYEGLLQPTGFGLDLYGGYAIPIEFNSITLRVIPEVNFSFNYARTFGINLFAVPLLLGARAEASFADFVYIRPFIGIWMGPTIIKRARSGSSSPLIRAAFKFGFGASYPIWPTLTAGAGFYFTETSGDYMNFLVHVRYNFGDKGLPPGTKQ